jgi:DNA modification methylase
MAETSHAIVVGDSADLAFLADGSVDLVVTSPPYPMIAMWDAHFRARDAAVGRALDAGDAEGAFELMHRDLDRAWAQVHRVLRDGGLACVNVGDAVRTIDGRFRLHANHARVLDAFRRLGFDALPAVLWRKTTNAPTKFMGSGMLPAGAYVTLEHEYVLVLRKGGRRPFDGRDRARRRASAFFWEERNTWFSDTWDMRGARQSLDGVGDGAARQRSAAFPFEIAWRLVLMHSLRGDTVLDPFLGTGTTTLAAIAAGRSSVGVELDPAIAAAAREAALGSRGAANGAVATRLDAHRLFVTRRDMEGRPLRHANRPHGFAVMTAQEEDLLLELVDRIEPRDDGRLVVSYRAVPS